MYPIYFPFTYVNDNKLDYLNSCFEKFVVYQPSDLDIAESLHEKEKQGLVEIRIPLKNIEDEKLLKARLQEFRTWIVQQGKDISHMRNIKNIPFFDDNSPHGISYQVKNVSKSDRNTDNPDNADNANKKALLFLHIAQDMDKQNHELYNSLKSFDEKENQFLEELGKYSDKEAHDLSFQRSTILTQEDPGSLMTSERITAFARLFVKDDYTGNVFVTGSPAIMDYLTEHVSGIKEPGSSWVKIVLR